MNSTKNFDDKLFKNIFDEINRLNSQLNDLETYKDELPQEEIDSIKKCLVEELALKLLKKILESCALEVKDTENINSILNNLQSFLQLSCDLSISCMFYLT